MDELRRYLEDKGITQAAFAADMGVSQPTVSGWLSGSQFPTGRKLKQISATTGISLDRLLSLVSCERSA